MILELVENGPLIWPTVEENGVTRTKKYAELSVAEKIQADCDMKATNIIRQGFAAPVFSLGDDLIACLNKAMAFLTAVASSSNATSFGGNNASGQARVVKCYNYQGEGHMARQCTQPKRPRNATWYKEKAMLAEAGQILDEEQLAFLADPGVLDGQAVQTIIPNNAAFQTKDLDTYDFDCDDISNAQVVLMANISNYGSDIISKAQQDSMILSVIEQMSEQMINHVNNWEKANKEHNNESVTAELERYKERVKTFEQRLNIDLSSREKMIDSQMDDMIKEKVALKEQVDSLKQNLSKQIKEKECLLQTFTVLKNESKEKEDKYMENEIDLEKKIKELDNILFKVGQSAQTKAQRIKPTLYDGIVISDKHVAMLVIDDEETLILEEESRSKMSEKVKDPEVINKNISHKPIDYEKLNRQTKDFGKRFAPQQELSAEQAFWLRMSDPTSKPSDSLPVKIKAPNELPKISLVNEGLKKHKFHLSKFDNVVKIRTIPNARTEGEWGFEHTKAVFNNEIIPFLKSLKDIFNVFDRDILNEIMEVKTVFDQIEAAVQQSSVDKQSQLQDKDSTICKLKDMIQLMREKSKDENVKYDYCEIETKNVELENRKEIVDIAAQIPSASTFVPGMFKLDLEPLAPRLLQNRDVHIKYIKYAQEQANILGGIVEQAKAKKPLDKDAKKVAVTPKKRSRKLGLKWSTSKCGSKPTGNKRNDRISQTTSRNMKNKVEVQPRKVNKKNHVVESICDVDVKHSLLNANSEPICANCSSKKAKIIKSKNANHSKPNHTWGSNARDIPSSSSLIMTGTVRFWNDHIIRIIGYGDYQLGNVTISRLAKDGLARGIPRLKFQKDHLCSACALGKIKKSSHQPKAEDTNQEKLYLLHMDLCGLMRVSSINGKRYILVIVDDYSRFTWVRFLRTKDEAPEAIIKCIKNIQVRLNATVRNVLTDNRTEFVNQTLHEFYENVGISHQKSVARTPQ
ncbi:retrovirus-related pol polyprotein from transposon TNT 1-94 [Tanacetum coccineum]|uniref:Retrovirus-related pol polyprotein from transposon TNT 1-94 n=1 Tax=Tanacetum coccineum TaxID=301880 RepID=A0ABQ4WZX8_9ASTR